MRIRHTTAALFINTLVSPALYGQWSPDPTINTLVSGTMTDCVITHCAASPDGGTWIAWYHVSSGYDIVVQKLDATGVPVFAEPTLVQDQSLSWVQDFDLAAVGDSCALAWADGTTTGAALVGADGLIAWHHDLQDSNGYQANAQVCGTNDGFTIIGWMDEDVSKVQRVAADGTLAWASPVEIGGNGYFAMSDLVASSDHDVVVSMVHYTSFNGAKKLKAQRVRADGSLAWTAPAIDVFTQGSLQYGAYPECIADDTGGGIFTWYSTSNLQSYIQWIDGDGQKRFGTGGSVVASSGNLLHVSPSACFDASASEATAFCIREASNQSEHGVQANRFDTTGTALWGAEGIEISAQDSSWTVLDLQAHQLGTLACVTWLKAAVTGQGTVQSQAVHDTGEVAWGSTPVVLGEPAIDRWDLSGATSSDKLVAAWSDERDGESRVWAQNIGTDGELGEIGCPADITGDEVVDVNDVLYLIATWGTDDAAADVDGDGVVATEDLLAVLAGWGPCS